MILPLLKKPRTTRPNTRLPISASRSFLIWRLAVVSSVGALFLSSTAADAGELKWSRPAAPRRVVQRRSVERVVQPPRKAMFRDPSVVAAVWDEDDGFVASHVAKTQAVEDRSVVVRRLAARRMPPRDRLAQLPDDPFDQAGDAPAPELDIEDPPIEEVEKAIEQELDRRESEQDVNEQDLFGDSPGEELLAEEDSSADADLQDLFEEETMEEETMEEETTEDEPEAAKDDPFDEPRVEQLTVPGDGDSILDEAEEAIERPQVETPRTERDLFDESMDDQDSPKSRSLSDLFDEDTRKDEPEGSTLLEAEKDDSGLDVEADDESRLELENQANDEGQDERLKEREESEKNCADEIAMARADRIDDIDLSITLEGDAGEDFPYECRLDAGQHEPRQWPQITYNWKAAALCHKPLYFEQVQLERYGHSWGPYIQPIMSGVHFFGTLPVLPYKMGIRTPTECVYTLGYYRPGSCAPYMIDPIPFTWRAALFQGGFTTGLFFAIP